MAGPDAGPRCGDPTALLVLACPAGHRRLVAACSDHGVDAMDLFVTNPAALASCALCEDLTGSAEDMTLASVEP